MAGILLQTDEHWPQCGAYLRRSAGFFKFAAPDPLVQNKLEFADQTTKKQKTSIKPLPFLLGCAPVFPAGEFSFVFSPTKIIRLRRLFRFFLFITTQPQQPPY